MKPLKKYLFLVMCFAITIPSMFSQEETPTYKVEVKNAAEASQVQTTPLPQPTFEVEDEPNAFQKLINRLAPYFADNDSFLNFRNIAYGFLVILIGWLSPFLPWLNKILDVEKRVLTIGMSLIAFFLIVQFGTVGITWEDGLELLLSFAFSTKALYDGVLAPAGFKTIKPPVAA